MNEIYKKMLNDGIDVEDVRRAAEREALWVLDNGLLFEDGTTLEILDNDNDT